LFKIATVNWAKKPLWKNFRGKIVGLMLRICDLIYNLLCRKFVTVCLNSVKSCSFCRKIATSCRAYTLLGHEVPLLFLEWMQQLSCRTSRLRGFTSRCTLLGAQTAELTDVIKFSSMCRFADCPATKKPIRRTSLVSGIVRFLQIVGLSTSYFFFKKVF